MCIPIILTQSIIFTFSSLFEPIVLLLLAFYQTMSPLLGSDLLNLEIVSSDTGDCIAVGPK